MLIPKPFSRVGDSSFARIEKPMFFHDNFIDYCILVTDDYLNGLLPFTAKHHVIDRYVDKNEQWFVKLVYKTSVKIKYYANLSFIDDRVCQIRLYKVHSKNRRYKR